MLQAKLGRFPIQINIKMLMVSFWLSVVTGSKNKFSYIIYPILRSEFDSGFYEHTWLKKFQSFSQETGRNDVWLSYNIENAAVINKNIYRTRLNQNSQIWQATVDSSSKGHNYKIFKSEIGLERYFIELPKTIYIPLVKF